MRFDVLTLFPEIFSGYLTQSLLKLAIDRDLASVHLHNLRDYSKGKHKEVDDRPFGGGPGMLLKPEPTIDCVEAVQADPSAGGPGRLLMLTPQGRRLDQPYVEDLAQSPRLLLLCGRYEGFDQRITDLLQPEEVSIGDYVLNGGEVAAMTIIDAVVRLEPGVLGDETSSQEDTFSRAGRNLEYAQYTRPREYRGLAVPEVLLSGDHEAIARWREQNAAERTQQRRADLLPAASRSDQPAADTTN
ncbi:tRNA (guanosine(37)-N1)-methyltransferase TrmD [Botrimarina hoheduenensis]|uniref:tRNA (guanine-N(1)-)-methyltransferase n=1 Tax=Botrimarina hoheduenensis TaxID=2528000 RepID=A0A5C5WB12_9BACT|nr:tRNA (guanosine(37)-N1)-methyltransferase TrmD [Botrimarina hoheduenensis]TWT47784.1 tRNA (guanine-N(1)-)-methyltransferase [Botrimarina hoheduenensis]